MAEGWTRRTDQVKNKQDREYSTRETNSVFFFGGSPAKEGALPHPSTSFPWPRTSFFVQKVLSCRNKAIVHCRGFLFSTPDCKNRPRVWPAKIKWCGKWLGSLGHSSNLDKRILNVAVLPAVCDLLAKKKAPLNQIWAISKFRLRKLISICTISVSFHRKIQIHDLSRQLHIMSEPFSSLLC